MTFYDDAADRFTATVSATDDWTAASPCEGWSAADVVDHVVDGQLVSTRYAHMQYGSLQVSTGDIVKAGDVIGRVGSTGKATGPHLHFEVLLGGTVHTDPMAWMRQHTEE